MANIAIKIMFGNSPIKYTTGKEYFFRIGSRDSKISPNDIEEGVLEVIEEYLEKKYGEPYAVDD